MDQAMPDTEISDEEFATEPVQSQPPTGPSLMPVAEELTATTPIHYDIFSEPDEHLPLVIPHDPPEIDPSEERPPKKQAVHPEKKVSPEKDTDERTMMMRTYQIRGNPLQVQA